MKFAEYQILKSAAAIANARGMRRGVPEIVNILDLLPEKLREEVIEDATAALEAIEPLEFEDARLKTRTTSKARRG